MVKIDFVVVVGEVDIVVVVVDNEVLGYIDLMDFDFDIEVVVVGNGVVVVAPMVVVDIVAAAVVVGPKLVVVVEVDNVEEELVVDRELLLEVVLDIEVVLDNVVVDVDNYHRMVHDIVAIYLYLYCATISLKTGRFFVK